ncbi:hypothetical protein GCM10028791_31720 [Echinicola sediminis]
MKNFKAIGNIVLILFAFVSCNSKNDKAADNGSIQEEMNEETPRQVKFRYEMESAAYPDAMLELYSPLEDQTFEEGKVAFEFNVKNYPFDQGNSGSSLKMIINGNDPVDCERPAFNKEFQTGAYKVLAYLVDKKGIALKAYGNYVDRGFAVGNSSPFPETAAPIIGINMPHNGQEYAEDETITIDFIMVGGDLEEDKLKVKVTVGQEEYLIERLGLIKMTGLSAGEHEVTVALVDNEGKELPGIFTKSIKRIKVKPV